MNIYETYIKHRSFKKVMNVFSQEEAKSAFAFLLEQGSIINLPLLDKDNYPIVVDNNYINTDFDFILKQQINIDFKGDEKLIDEIVSTLAIENVYTTRKTVEEYLKNGYSTDIHVKNTREALKFIERCVEEKLPINKELVNELYHILTVGTLEKDEIITGYYRNDNVSVMSGTETVHQGPSHQKIPAMMDTLFELMNSYSEFSLSFTYTLIHFYIGYVHPYFDGNGRMARMLSAWYLLKNNVSKIFVYQLSKMINERRSDYYKAYIECEDEKFAIERIVLNKFYLYFLLIGKEVANHRNYSLKYQILLQTDTFLSTLTHKEQSILYSIINSYFDQEFTTGTMVSRGFASEKTRRDAMKKFKLLEIVEESGNKNKYVLTKQFKFKLSS